MIYKREAQEITDWLVIFHTDCLHWWFRMIPGRYKHVSAFGWSAGLRAWLFYDVSWRGTKMVLLPEGKTADDRIADWSRSASVLRFQARDYQPFVPKLLTCVSAMTHLLGVRGAVQTPVGLWKLLLSEGATVVWEHNGGIAELRRADVSVDAATAGDAAAGAATAVR